MYTIHFSSQINKIGRHLRMQNKHEAALCFARQLSTKETQFILRNKANEQVVRIVRSLIRLQKIY